MTEAGDLKTQRPGQAVKQNVRLQVMVTLLEPLHEGGAIATAAARVVEAIVILGGQQFKVLCAI